jgi:outer membrane protein
VIRSAFRRAVTVAAASLPGVVLLPGASVPLAAQQLSQDTVRLSLSEAVSRAVALSEEVETARAQRSVASAQITQARAGALPQVSGSVVYNRTLASIFDNIRLGEPAEPEPGEDPAENPFAGLPFGQANTWIATLSIAQPLFTAGRVGTALAIARNVRAAADLEVEEAEAAIALQVRTAYFQTILADEMVGIARQAYALADATLAQVELFRQQGTAAEFDVLRARVERDNLQPAIIEAENARRLAELNLKQLINLPAEQPIETTTSLTPVVAEVDRALLAAALGRRPALRSLDQQVAAREGAVRIARANRLPSVDLSANFAYQAFPDQVAPFDTDWRRDWTLSFATSIPIFDGLRTRGQIEEAQAELRLVRLQREQVRQGLELELEAALGEFDAVRAQMEARAATVMEAERTLELAELRFRSGLATQLDISNARLLLQQARVNEVQALFNYINALARLERTAGGEIPLVQPRLPDGE